MSVVFGVFVGLVELGNEMIVLSVSVQVSIVNRFFYVE